MMKHDFMKNLSTLIGITICLVCFALTSQAEVGSKTVAPLIDDLGGYSYPVSDCSGQAQRFFDQGLRLYYGFYYPEAVVSFREAARLDPDCPMVYWGEALAIAPNPNSRYNRLPDDPQGQGKEAVGSALRLVDRASDKERGLIEALNAFYESSVEQDSSLRDQAYTDALRRLHEYYPDDPEVGTLYAEALMTSTAWRYWTPDGRPRPGTNSALAALNKVLEKYPDHPGANHLFIHLVESSQNPEVALPHAKRLAYSMPGAGHIVHMPSHIYIRAGQYKEAEKSNLRSLAADRRFLEVWDDRELPIGIPSYSLSATNHGIHAEEFLYLIAVLQGNYTIAIESARKVAARVKPKLATSGTAQRRYVRPMLTLRRFGKWDEIINEPAPDTAYPFVSGIWHFVRGSAYAATGKLTEMERELTALQAVKQAEGMHELMVRVNSAATLLTIAEHVLLAEITVQKGDFDQALAHLESAVRIEDSLAYMEPPDWDHPVRHSLGEVLLGMGRAQEAETVFWEDLRRNPENGWSLFGVRQSLLMQGKDALAAEIEERFRKSWEGADVTLPIGRPTSR
ncbi:MAG: tetratricopeptide repeat protein [Gammaproteobacteria bacterium]